MEDVRKRSPGPGQVLIKIGGAGVCHSDLHLMEEDLGFKPSFTLGHENAGWVSALGEGVLLPKKVVCRGAFNTPRISDSDDRTQPHQDPENGPPI